MFKRCSGVFCSVLKHFCESCAILKIPQGFEAFFDVVRSSEAFRSAVIRFEWC